MQFSENAAWYIFDLHLSENFMFEKKMALYSSYPTLNLHKSTSLNLDASFPPMVFRSFGFLFKKNVLLMATIASYERKFDILHPRLYKG